MTYNKNNTNSPVFTYRTIYSYKTKRREINEMNKMQSSTNFNTSKNKNYGDAYNFPTNYPSVAQMQNSMISVGTNMGTIPF